MFLTTDLILKSENYSYFHESILLYSDSEVGNNF